MNLEDFFNLKHNCPECGKELKKTIAVKRKITELYFFKLFKKYIPVVDQLTLTEQKNIFFSREENKNIQLDLKNTLSLYADIQCLGHYYINLNTHSNSIREIFVKDYACIEFTEQDTCLYERDPNGIEGNYIDLIFKRNLQFKFNSFDEAKAKIDQWMLFT